MSYFFFMPRFWGSFESRWELGRWHYADRLPSGLIPARTLCGKGISEFQNEESIDAAQPSAAGRDVCKTCRRLWEKRRNTQRARRGSAEREERERARRGEG